MTAWTLVQVQHVTGGVWVRPPLDANVAVRSFQTDSRAVGTGDAFVAMRGEKLNGNEFLASASESGAALVIADDESAAQAVRAGIAAVLLVDDGLLALHDLARAQRQRLRRSRTKVIAVTGSAGKTTTRHLIHTVLATTLRGTQSLKSFNNHVGVPLTLLAASPSHAFVVVEMGTNHPGEIAALAELTRPDAAVLTNIGTAHLGNFAGREGIAAEKSAIFQYITRGGLAVYPGDEPLLNDVAIPARAERVRFGRTDACELVLTDCRPDETGCDMTVQCIGEVDAFGSWTVRDLKLRLGMPGEHNGVNALAALAVARWMCVDPESEAIARALRDPGQLDMRLNVARVGPPGREILLINDAYNANPDSVEAALRTLQRCKPLGNASATSGRSGPSRVAILGDMLELGEQGPALHRRVGACLAGLTHPPIDRAILIGKLSMFTAEAVVKVLPADRVHVFPEWSDQVPGRVASYIHPGDAVLIKASRGMALERLIPALTTPDTSSDKLSA